jgi:glycosyltransferase involved in cell wall biosynthesis
MRILFDHQIFCLQQYGGISRYFSEIARSFASMTDKQVEIFAPLYLNEYLSSLESVRLKGVKIPNLSKLGRFVAWGMNTALALSMVRSRHDVDIFHETYYSGVDYCPRAAKRIVTVYDMIPEIFGRQYPGQERTCRMKVLAVSRADHVICISESTRKDLIDILGVDPEKISVVYLGCKTGASVRGKPAPANKPYILFVGKRTRNKNFEILLHAYSHSLKLRRELTLICFGGGPFSRNERLLMKSLSIRATSVVQISGDDNLLSGLYLSATAFIYPSLYEGFGLPLLEAMSLGCPVICSNASSFPEVAGDAAVLFDPEDVDAIQDAIEKVVFSTDLKDSLIQRGYERIKQFPWSKCARETLQVYEQQFKT